MVDGVVGVEFEETGSGRGSRVGPDYCANGGREAGECRLDGVWVDVWVYIVGVVTLTRLGVGTRYW